MKSAIRLVGLVLLVALSTAAQAVTVRHQFTGFVSASSPELGFAAGSPITYALQFSSDTPDVNADPSVGVYLSIQQEVYFGLTPMGFAPNSTLLVGNNVLADLGLGLQFYDAMISSSSAPIGPEVNGLTLTQISSLFLTNDLGLLDDDGLPIQNSDVLFQDANVTLTYGQSLAVLHLTGVQTFYAPVPLPATAWLMVSGVAAFGAAVRKKRKQVV